MSPDFPTPPPMPIPSGTRTRLIQCGTGSVLGLVGGRIATFSSHAINLAVSRTYTRSPNGFPMDAQWTPNGRPNGRPMDAYEKWAFGDDGLEKRKCVECAYLFFKCTITKSPFFTGVHWASIGASIGRPLGVHWVSNIDALNARPCACQIVLTLPN